MRCAKCGAKARDEGQRSPLGEQLCGGCYTTVAGAAAGMMSGAAGGGVGGAITGAGILAWVRKALGKGEAQATVSEATKKKADDSEGGSSPDDERGSGGSW